jgi:glycosyltransferase involved in cell wall biosynthesis
VPDLSVVIPVYNEEENLPHLWPELREVLEPLGLAF